MPSPAWPHPIYLNSWTKHSRFLCNIIFFHHWTLLSLPDLSTAEGHFYFCLAASFFVDELVMALYSSPAAYWTPSNLGAHLTVSYLFAFSYCPWCSLGKNTEVVFHFLFQWSMVSQNSSPWPTCLGWSCKDCLLPSLSYWSPFAMTRLWSMKGQETKIPHAPQHGLNKKTTFIIIAQ